MKRSMDYLQVKVCQESNKQNKLKKSKDFIIEYNKIGTEKWIKLDNDHRFFYAKDAFEKLKSLILFFVYINNITSFKS